MANEVQEWGGLHVQRERYSEMVAIVEWGRAAGTTTEL